MENNEESYWKNWLSEKYGDKLKGIRAHVLNLLRDGKLLPGKAKQFEDHCREVENLLHILIPY